MNARQLVAAVSVSTVLLNGAGFARVGFAQPPTPETAASHAHEATPARLSYLHGEVSFWRPGAEAWAPARLNTALAPGDVLYTAPGATLEIQIGPRAFVRAAERTQIGLDNQEPDFLQFRVTAGQAALDVRELPAGHTVELDTPNAAFTVERTGYYRVDVTGESVRFSTHRGGHAIAMPANGAATPVAANQQVTLVGLESSRVELGPAPALAAWDEWNYRRTASLLQSPASPHVSSAIYGAHELDRYGTWTTADPYGPIWMPSAVPAGWVPYSAGRWMWDPIYGWTWLDDAPWGWAPYHYGRWVFVGRSWAWAPGPVIARPAYTPALVAFLGGVTVSVGRPLAWAPLGWGEPVIPWWGRRGFVGVPSWRGWGGPRVVNNVVVDKSTVVNVNNINVYKNVHVVNGVVGVPAERFGRERIQPSRLSQADVRDLRPIRGPLAARPVAASLMPATAAAVRPPDTIQQRRIVSTRPPMEVAPILRAHGLREDSDANRAAPPRLVPSPRAVDRPAREPRAPQHDAARAPMPERPRPDVDASPRRNAERPAPRDAEPRRLERGDTPRREERPAGEQRTAPSTPGTEPRVERPARLEPSAPRIERPRADPPRVERPARQERPDRVETPSRVEARPPVPATPSTPPPPPRREVTPPSASPRDVAPPPARRPEPARAERPSVEPPARARSEGQRGDGPKRAERGRDGDQQRRH